MKYGIIVSGRVTEPVTIPDPLPEWASTPAEFLSKLYPDKSGWVEVPGDAVPGTIANGDGTFSSSPVQAAVQKWDAFDFKMRFTADERKAIRAAAKLNADVEDFVDMLDTAAATGTMIHADNAMVSAALDAMTPTILAEGRKAEILGA